MKARNMKDDASTLWNGNYNFLTNGVQRGQGGVLCCALWNADDLDVEVMRIAIQP